MPALVRVTQRVFGANGSSGNFGEFGSKAEGDPTYSLDIAAIMSRDAWVDNGWADAVVDGNVPELEDMNGAFKVAFYQLAYMFEQGVPEWDSGTTYWLNSICKYNGELYVSLQNTNLNKSPASEPTYWANYLGAKGVQPGVMQFYGGLAAPTGYLLCDGSAISRTDYAALFAIIGTNFGVGNGTTTFNIPDMREAVPAGYKVGSDVFGTFGATVGAKTVNLQHSHGGVTGGVQFGGGGTLTAGALDTPHFHSIANDLSATQSIVQPSVVANWIIKT